MPGVHTNPHTLASHQCGPGSIPGLGVICRLSLLLVVVLAPKGLSPGTPVFPTPQKPTFPNSNSIWINYCQALYHEPLAREIVQALPMLSTLNKFIYLLQFNGTIKNKTIRIICKRVEHSIQDRSPSS